MTWARIYLVVVLSFIGLATAMEVRLKELGYRPTIVDSDYRWVSERARASQIGRRALILIGASRIQLGLDLDILRKETGLEPVQLAIDGNSFAPILENLADDPTITGTVLVDYYDSSVIEYGGGSTDYLRRYREYVSGGAKLSPSATAENFLGELLHEHLRIYSDGASPFSTLLLRVIGGVSARQYLDTLPDRSRVADYSVEHMPQFYYKRVIRELGVEMDPESSNIVPMLSRNIAALKPSNNNVFIKHAGDISRMVKKITDRGGRVMFVSMPTSGMVHEIEERRFPRAQFWDQFVKEEGVPALRSADIPTLRDFTCPDGSHLDVRSRSRFTVALSSALNLSRLVNIRSGLESGQRQPE
jgi:hypothetical protein